MSEDATTRQGYRLAAWFVGIVVVVILVSVVVNLDAYNDCMADHAGADAFTEYVCGR